MVGYQYDESGSKDVSMLRRMFDKSRAFDEEEIWFQSPVPCVVPNGRPNTEKLWLSIAILESTENLMFMAYLEEAIL